MRFTTLLPALLSTLSLTSALPNGQPSTWQATNFELNCSPGGCGYRFNITGSKSENSPAFATYCDGITENTTVCADSSITAYIKPLTNPTWNVKVQHEWHIIEESTNSEQIYWQSGNTNVTETTTQFQIKPNVFYGVA
ncbi:hypothetical protein N7462_011147 [Penicillium macrosclerotiorum]|uniref:uncharacterized protein n=1 Tax=Penicillium macrosclerotiorum TaxID=303699 RepID=UPI00254931FF|nr:uncharacterized protein N7462_011147 [Penicillium macrosclerotiorum]KAJ5666738.1 hypothetical protein N7462_011147 [Penicillium macrosclerotiorum]